MGGESGIPAIPYCRSLSLLGERSAGVLYAADSDRYGGAVTVTVYPRPADDRARRRFEAAVETARRLGAHPHLVTIHASGHTDGDGRPYVVSDGHDRTTAAGVLATSGVLGVDSVLPIGVALAGALETGHRAGLVHGGVAPGLVLLRADGQPVLTEIGLYEFARPQGASAHLARWIPYHAPPEILEGTDVTAATDVYSLASVIYTLLVGQPPYAGTGVDDSTASLLLRILQMPMPPIERSDVPPGLEDVLRASLSHSPAKRPQHALELAWAMQEAQRTAGLEITEPFVMDLGSGGSVAPGAAGAAGAAALGSPALPEALPAPGSAGGPKDWSFLTPPLPAAGAAGAAGTSVFGPTGGAGVAGADQGGASPWAARTDDGTSMPLGRPDENAAPPWAAGNGTPTPLGRTDDPSASPWASAAGNATSMPLGRPDGGGASPWAAGNDSGTPMPLGRGDDAASSPWAGDAGEGTNPWADSASGTDGGTPPWAGGTDNGTSVYGSTETGTPTHHGAADSPGNGTNPWADSASRTDDGTPPWAGGAGNGTSTFGSTETGATHPGTGDGANPWGDSGNRTEDGGTPPWAGGAGNGTSVYGSTETGAPTRHGATDGPGDGTPPWAGGAGNGTSVFGGSETGQPSHHGATDSPGNGTNPWADSASRPDDGGTSAWGGGNGTRSPENGTTPWADSGSRAGGAENGTSVFGGTDGPASNPTPWGPSAGEAANGAFPTPLGGGGVGAPSNGYGSGVAASADGAPLPRRDAGSGPRGVSTPADNGLAGALPRRGGTGGDSPQTATPWWATPPFGTTAVSGSVAPTPPTEDGPLGPLGNVRPNPLDSPMLHQPLPTDERPPIDTRVLGEAFDSRRRALPNRPAVPQARQAPSPTAPSPGPSPAPAPTRRRRGQDPEADTESTAGAGDATSRRSRRSEGRNRTGPGNDRPAGPSAPATTADDGRQMSALERARLARIERQQRERAGGDRDRRAGRADAGRPAAATATVAEPRHAHEAPADGSPSRRPIGATPDMAAPRTGPPALPVLVLVVLVLVLGLGGAWMVVTGEDGPEPASETDEPAPDQETTTTAADTPPNQAAFTPNRASDLTAIEGPTGVQLDWEGPEGSAYLVRILSPTEPPRPLGAGPATALLIPPDLVQPGGSYCFDVVAAPAEGEPPVSVPEDPAQVTFPTACIGGATAENVVRP